MINPSGYSLEEANAMVGTRIVRVFDRVNGDKVDGRQGKIVAAEQTPHFHGNNYQHFVAVEWVNRDGSRSTWHRYSKEQIAAHTRPMRIQEIAAEQQRKEATFKRTFGQARKRGLGI